MEKIIGRKVVNLSLLLKEGKTMRKYIPTLWCVTLLTGIAISCGGNSEKTKMNLEALKKQLESGQTPNREAPFSVHQFEPYLEGSWIGNAVSYGCYRRGHAPGVKGPSESEILEDLNIIIKHWNLIRVYSSDDDSERILRIIQQNQLPVRVMLGVWLENERKHPERRAVNIEQALRAITLAHQFPGIVSAINVGNETQVYWSAHRMNPVNLIRYIRAVRNHVSVPVTTADDYNFWNKPESEKVAVEIDIIVAHMYAMWNGKTLQNAIKWTDTTYHQVQSFHPKKPVVLGETGWATKYNAEKKGPGEQGTLIKDEVSLRAQEIFLLKLHQWVHQNQVTTFLFEAFDEPWKGGGENSGPNEIEKHWGVFYENRTPKPSFQNYLKEIKSDSKTN